MAYTQKPLLHVCRSCRLSLTGVFNRSRAFSGTTNLRKTLVEFSPTSSPELDAIFNKYRETLFIPSVLSEDHRRLIYRPSKHGQLLNEPGVTVTLPNDEDLKLQPMQLGQRPVKRQTIVKIKEILASTEDDNAWNNLIPFLEGMKTAKEPIEIKHVGQITRKAYERGKYSIPVRCAELAKRTDFRLRYPGLASVIFTGCHNRAAAAGFEGDELLAAAKQAEYIALMLEREEHCGGSLKDNQVDARKELRIVGVLLELAAAKAIHLHASTDLDGQVARYVAKSLALSDGHEFKPTTFERPHYRSDKGPSSEKKPLSEEESQRYIVSLRGAYLVKNIPLWHGMKLASKVEGAVSPELAPSFEQGLKLLEKNIRTAVADCRPAERHRPTKALQMFDQVQSLQR